MNLSPKVVCVYDRGLFLHVARKLGEVYKRVLYYMPSGNPYPESALGKIGVGVPGIERIYSLPAVLDEVDLFVFPDVYSEGWPDYLREHGRRVFGAGEGEELETDRQLLKDVLTEAGLPTVPYHPVRGVDNLRDYLMGKKDLYVKRSYYRGDFETYHHESQALTDAWLDDLITKLGPLKNEVEFLVEEPIKAACEVGFDGFCIDGQYPKNCGVGFEMKDRGIVERIFTDPPKVLADVNKAMSPILAEYGYRGFYSNELRITAKGETFFTDATCRAGSPPSELMVEMYTPESFAQAVWDVAEGRVPELDPVAEYGAEIILKSPWHANHWLPVKFPKDICPFVKLKNCTKVEGVWNCVPNGNAEYFGAVVAVGDTLEEATTLCQERFDSILTLEIDHDAGLFAEAQEVVEAAEKVGIHF